MTPSAVATVNLYMPRGVPFLFTFDFVGFDYSAATFTMELRRYRDQSGSPLVALTNALATAQGISVTTTTDGGIVTSHVQVRINETTVEGLPFTSPRGGDYPLQYALDIAGGGHPKLRRVQGTALVGASANG